MRFNTALLHSAKLGDENTGATLTPVSYTHLSQTLKWLESGKNPSEQNGEIEGTEPVSYTHLDVYKRQHLWRTAARQIRNI